MKKITVIGLGYVGMSLATLLSTKHEVITFDIDENKVRLLREKKSPIQDKQIEEFLTNKDLNLFATTDKEEAIGNSDYYIIATPTNYNEETQYFDTKSIESVIKMVSDSHPGANIVIKSTIPISYTKGKQEEFPNINLIFSPEFLREGSALYDNLYPDRIIVSPKENQIALEFGKLLQACSLKEDVPLLSMNTTEAEAVKLFANTYLAMRVSYFNELDTFAESNHLNSEDIIKGVSLEKRIGDFYNNPSFGYGGYCLPKDTKQLKANFNQIPNSLISAIVEANDKRKEYIADQIICQQPKTVGVYRLAMKADSDNFRASSIRDVMKRISEQDIEIIIFDENLRYVDSFEEFKVISNLDDFKKQSDIIITNRMDRKLDDVENKVYTRDIFGGN